MDIPPTQRTDAVNLECAAPAVMHALGVNNLRLLLRNGGDRLEKLLRKQMDAENVDPPPGSERALSEARRDWRQEEGARMSWDLLSDGEREGFLAVVARIDPSVCDAVARALDPDRNRTEA